MANKEHLGILKQGVEVWNRWRKEHPRARPNLSEADLRRAVLLGANLSRTDLSQTDLSQAILVRANLSRADLRAAHLGDADLGDAVLSGANLSGADLHGAYLSGADLSRAYLSGADLSNAHMEQTVLNELDLHQVKGLETVGHTQPSDIGVQTIYLSQGEIPEVFLRGAGVPENFIEYMRSLTGKAFVYYSCFISHSSKDKDFCQRLYNDLQGAGVRCWLDSEDLKIGDKFWERIDDSIRLHDKLLVVLSEQSIASDWVEREVMSALEKEGQSPGRTVLFPISLDDAVKTARHPWAADLRRRRHIGDFSNWKEHDAYQQAFTRLLRDLKAEAS